MSRSQNNFFNLFLRRKIETDFVFFFSKIFRRQQITVVLKILLKCLNIGVWLGMFVTFVTKNRNFFRSSIRGTRLWQKYQIFSTNIFTLKLESYLCDTSETQRKKKTVVFSLSRQMTNIFLFIQVTWSFLFMF